MALCVLEWTYHRALQELRGGKYQAFEAIPKVIIFILNAQAHTHTVYLRH